MATRLKSGASNANSYAPGCLADIFDPHCFRDGGGIVVCGGGGGGWGAASRFEACLRKKRSEMVPGSSMAGLVSQGRLRRVAHINLPNHARAHARCLSPSFHGRHRIFILPFPSRSPVPRVSLHCFLGRHYELRPRRRCEVTRFLSARPGPTGQHR